MKFWHYVIRRLIAGMFGYSILFCDGWEYVKYSKILSRLHYYKSKGHRFKRISYKAIRF